MRLACTLISLQKNCHRVLRYARRAFAPRVSNVSFLYQNNLKSWLPAKSASSCLTRIITMGSIRPALSLLIKEVGGLAHVQGEWRNILLWTNQVDWTCGYEAYSIIAHCLICYSGHNSSEQCRKAFRVKLFKGGVESRSYHIFTRLTPLSLVVRSMIRYFRESMC